jgi:hypothetical protein
MITVLAADASVHAASLASACGTIDYDERAKSVK